MIANANDRLFGRESLSMTNASTSQIKLLSITLLLTLGVAQNVNAFPNVAIIDQFGMVEGENWSPKKIGEYSCLNGKILFDKVTLNTYLPGKWYSKEQIVSLAVNAGVQSDEDAKHFYGTLISLTRGKCDPTISRTISIINHRTGAKVSDYDCKTHLFRPTKAWKRMPTGIIGKWVGIEKLSAIGAEAGYTERASFSGLHRSKGQALALCIF